MKLVIADTGALISLGHVGYIHLIEEVFGDFYIAKAVWEELKNYENPEFDVETDDCNCSISLPAIYDPITGLAVSPSLNVQSYRIWIYDALGRLVLATTDEEIRLTHLPFVSGAYFWWAELSCLSKNDIPIKRAISGKTMVIR